MPLLHSASFVATRRPYLRGSVNDVISRATCGVGVGHIYISFSINASSFVFLVSDFGKNGNSRKCGEYTLKLLS